MPTNRKKRTQSLRQLNDNQISNLVIGYHLIDPEDAAFEDEKARKEAWELNRDWLIRQRDFEGLFFGGSIMEDDTKPVAYYQYEKGLTLDEDFELERKLRSDKKKWLYYFKPLRGSGPI